MQVFITVVINTFIKSNAKVTNHFTFHGKLINAISKSPFDFSFANHDLEFFLFDSKQFWI